MITSRYTVERGLRLVAGVLILVTVVLAVYVNVWWLAFTAFIGANLLQSAFTNWCPMMPFLRGLGFRPERQHEDVQHAPRRAA